MLKPPAHQLISIEADLTGAGLLQARHGQLRPITANRATLQRGQILASESRELLSAANAVRCLRRRQTSETSNKLQVWRLI